MFHMLLNRLSAHSRPFSASGTAPARLAASLISFLLLLASVAPASAQLVYFGKNRVQYEDFEWRFIETEHFDIYYYSAANYHLAQFTAESVESALKQLSQDFNHQITDRISVIIYDSHGDFSQTNVVALPVDAQGIGGVTDKFKNRMTQPFMGDYADFRRTLHHELVHAFINDMYYGGTLQSIVQNNIQLVFPTWFEEGLAEYLALGWDTNTDMYMREAVIHNFLPPLNQLFGYYAYRGGQSFWYFIEATYGRPKVTEILQRVKSMRSVEQALTQSLGLSPEELSERWEEFLKKRYFPEVAERESITSIATQITKRRGFGTYNTSPAISPQGDKIAFISNRRGLFDVILVDALSGERIRTLVRGEDNPMFEELNILNPNLDWAPDGSAILLSTKSGGDYVVALVDAETGDTKRIEFPNLDGIRSVSWSPDARKIAFDGNVGPYQDIFVYDLESGDFTNLTYDVFTDREPAWGSDSNTLYFVSDRGDHLRTATYLSGFSIMEDTGVYASDLYRMDVQTGQLTRLTRTPYIAETQPAVTAEDDLYYISDENGIHNIWHYDLRTMVSRPVTDLQSGAMQISVSRDGSRLAMNSLNEGYLDVFLLRNPKSRIRQEPLSPNAWARMRDSQLPEERVRALGYARNMIRARPNGNSVVYDFEEMLVPAADTLSAAPAGPVAVADTVDAAQTPDTLKADVVRVPEAVSGGPTRIDFRNYVFAPEVAADTTLELRDDPRKFEPDNHLTESGYYQPKKYRLSFSPDFSYAAGGVDTYYGTAAFATFSFSDLFGDHQISLSSNLVFDLRNSTYIIQYGYLKQRTNFFASFFHQAQNYQTFSGELLRFRTFGLGANAQYPFNKFQRLDYGLTMIGISRDFSSLTGIGDESRSSDQSTFLYPEISFTGDFTVPGFITPSGGSRYNIRLSGSPPISPNEPQFVSLMGDYRRYFNLTSGYSIALRGTGAASFGRDSQTYFMGGMLGWINQRWSDVDIPFDRLADTFFTLPATPVRGHRYNTIYGDKFGLINAEFRFPLFAAVLPGPIPILPLYNITGVAFFDAGAAWGFDIDYYRYVDGNTGEPIVYHRNGADLDFRVGEEKTVFLDPATGLIRDGDPLETDLPTRYFDGDILMGAGFGLRTILLGLPFRYDIGWPLQRSGFSATPIHYFSIGIDF